MDVGYSKHKKIFTSERENILANYVKRSSEIMFGLTPQEVKQLAYQCAVSHKIKIPDSWIKNRKAGVDWFANFLKRTNLAIRQPEATSLARCTSCNKYNISRFFEKLGDIYQRCNLEPYRIWNMDETGVNTVLCLNKIVATKGTKQVGAVASAERGEQVTAAAAVNAQGLAMPPMILFPRKNFRDHFIRDGLLGCIGAANGSEWIRNVCTPLY
ncbi:hypothetical protein ILUMI_10395 [Ignelater luminosus]|uniref:Uncharacterized protein n=1 Tax=Ignelater luminosus TaxID=2038154 RepID=A0A8K0CXZ1_IGNLU|nr:hypothetical protein ILUMI_10395 [Ignelater luminosus]